MGALVWIKSSQPLILDSMIGKESPPSIKAPHLLLHRYWGDFCVLIDEGLSDRIQEERSFALFHTKWTLHPIVYSNLREQRSRATALNAYAT